MPEEGMCARHKSNLGVYPVVKILDARYGHHILIKDIFKLRLITLSEHGKSDIMTVVDEKLHQLAIIRNLTPSRDPSRFYSGGVYAFEDKEIRDELEKEGYINIRAWKRGITAIHVNEKLLQEQADIERRLNDQIENFAQKQKNVWEHFLRTFGNKGYRRKFGWIYPIDKEVTNEFVETMFRQGICYLAPIHKLPTIQSKPSVGVHPPDVSVCINSLEFVKRSIDNIFMDKAKKDSKLCFSMRLLRQLYDNRSKDLEVLLYKDYTGALVFFPAKIEQLEPPVDLDHEWTITVNDDFIEHSQRSRVSITFLGGTLDKEILSQLKSTTGTRYYYVLGQITNFVEELKIHVICLIEGGEIVSLHTKPRRR